MTTDDGDDYQIPPQGYLARCRDRLREGTKASIFYAALELRGCIEARHAEYFEHHEPLSSTKFQPWRLGENQKVVAKITEGDLISRITFRLSDGRSITQFHTPISTRLHRYAMRTVDGLRHAQNNYRTPNDPWWAETRIQLEEAYRDAWVACRGELPVPPMWNSETGEVFPIMIHFTKENRADLTALDFSAGVQMDMGVERLDAPPDDWIDVTPVVSSSWS